MKNKSTFFNFQENLVSKSFPKIMKFLGWSGLGVLKFQINANEKISSLELDVLFPEFKKKEKIFFITKGTASFISKSHFLTLKKYDVFNYLSTDKEFNICSNEGTIFYMVSCDKANLSNKDFKFFNFKNDIEIRDLWGGQCLSRVYESKNLTLVLFDLKPGFKFLDNGHSNEQITWLIDGQMQFHSNKIKKILNNKNGISIGKNHAHGGVSDGAVGFDVFFPKRKEKKYKKW